MPRNRCTRALYLSLLMLAPFIGACSQDAVPSSTARMPEAAPVVLDIVRSSEYAEPIEAIGTARALESVLITSRISGRVSEIYLDEGASVARGDALVLLENDSEHAELRAATATAAQARSRHERLQDLSSKGLVSRDELDTQRQLLDTSLARLELARVLLDQRTIRAPFAGRLGFRQVSRGALVQPGTAIVTLDAIDTIRVAFSVAETLIANIAPGGRVEAEAAAYRGRKLVGAIETIGTRVDEMTRAMPVQALLDNPGGVIKPGMLLTLQILATPRVVRHVPETALAPENARQFVWRVRDDATVEKVRVEIGVRARGWVEIVSGLELGDRVVLEGVANLRPGRPVREVSSPSVAPAVAES